MASPFSSTGYHAPGPNRNHDRKTSGSDRSGQATGTTTGTLSGTGGHGKFRPREDRRGSRYGRAALESEIDRLSLTSGGGRHLALFKAAARIGELVSGGELDEAWARSRLELAGDRLKPGHHAEIRRCVRDGLRRGQRQPRSAPASETMIRNASDARVRLSALIGHAHARPQRWTGVEGATQLRVLTGLVSLGLRAGKVRITASYREIAEASGVGLGAVRNAIAALEGEWTRVVRFGNRRRSKEPTCFQLLVDVDRGPLADADAAVPRPNGAGGTRGGGGHECSFLAPTVETAGFPTRPPGGLTEGLRDPGCPLWRRRANAWRIFNALEAAVADGESRTAAELADGLGIPLRTVWRNLGWLADAGLAASDSGRWRSVATETPDEVTERLELVPRQLTRQRHRLEQQLHRLRLRATGLRGWKAQAPNDAHPQIDDLLERTLVKHREVTGELDALRAVIAERRRRERAAALARRGRWRRR